MLTDSRLTVQLPSIAKRVHVLKKISAVVPRAIPYWYLGPESVNIGCLDLLGSILGCLLVGRLDFDRFGLHGFYKIRAKSFV